MIIYMSFSVYTIIIANYYYIPYQIDPFHPPRLESMVSHEILSEWLGCELRRLFLGESPWANHGTIATYLAMTYNDY